jgi:hypothetical protein
MIPPSVTEAQISHLRDLLPLLPPESRTALSALLDAFEKLQIDLHVTEAKLARAQVEGYQLGRGHRL